MDLPSEALREVKVEFKDDSEPLRAQALSAGRFARVTDVMGRIDYALSPLGESILLSARTCGGVQGINRDWTLSG